MYEVLTPLICAAIGGIVVGIIAGWLLKTWFVEDWVKAHQDLLNERNNHIQSLEERISLGNEQISTLNDLVEAKDDELIGVTRAYNDERESCLDYIDQLQVIESFLTRANMLANTLRDQLKAANDKIAELEKALQ